MPKATNTNHLLTAFRSVDALLPERARSAHSLAWSKRCEDLLAQISPTAPALLDDPCRMILARGPLALPIAIAAQHDDPQGVLLSFGPEWYARAKSADIDSLIAAVFAPTNVALTRYALRNREVSP